MSSRGRRRTISPSQLRNLMMQHQSGSLANKTNSTSLATSSCSDIMDIPSPPGPRSRSSFSFGHTSQSMISPASDENRGRNQSNSKSKERTRSSASPSLSAASTTSRRNERSPLTDVGNQQSMRTPPLPSPSATLASAPSSSKRRPTSAENPVSASASRAESPPIIDTEKYDMEVMSDLVWMLTAEDMADGDTEMAEQLAGEIESRSGYPAHALLTAKVDAPEPPPMEDCSGKPMPVTSPVPEVPNARKRHLLMAVQPHITAMNTEKQDEVVAVGRATGAVGSKDPSTGFFVYHETAGAAKKSPSAAKAKLSCGDFEARYGRFVLKRRRERWLSSVAEIGGGAWFVTDGAEKDDEGGGGGGGGGVLASPSAAGVVQSSPSQSAIFSPIRMRKRSSAAVRNRKTLSPTEIRDWVQKEGQEQDRGGGEGGGGGGAAAALVSATKSVASAGNAPRANEHDAKDAVSETAKAAEEASDSAGATAERSEDPSAARRLEVEAICAAEVEEAEARLMQAWEAALATFHGERKASERKCTLALYALERGGR